ncbi:MAG: beta-ketoacyl synthase N-terminal-like domain-containing protein, partial [Pseudomonadota bacterium]
MKLAASIAGVGTSRVGQVPDRSALQLQADAAQAALNDAGLKMRDIDGLLTTPVRVEHWNMPCGVVANHLGVKARYLSTVDVAGASGCAMIHQAAMAISSGQCSTVLCVAGQNLLTHGSRAKAVKSMAEGGSAHPQFEVPYGPIVPSLYALAAQRHMHQFGTTSEQMAEVAVTIRHHASLNPDAHKRALITVDDVMKSRM